MKESITAYEKLIKSLDNKSSQQEQRFSLLQQQNEKLKEQLHSKEIELEKLKLLSNEFKVIKNQDYRQEYFKNTDQNFKIKELHHESQNFRDNEEESLSIDDLEEIGRMQAEGLEDWSDSYDDMDGSDWANHTGGSDPEDYSNRF